MHQALKSYRSTYYRLKFLLIGETFTLLSMKGGRQTNESFMKGFVIITRHATMSYVIASPSGLPKRLTRRQWSVDAGALGNSRSLPSPLSFQSQLKCRQLLSSSNFQTECFAKRRSRLPQMVDPDKSCSAYRLSDIWARRTPNGRGPRPGP